MRKQLPLQVSALILVVLTLASSSCRRQVEADGDATAPEAQVEPTGKTNRKADPVSSESAATTPITADKLSPVGGLSNDRFERAFQSEAARVDPGRDGWVSEAFNEQVQAQLDLLGQWINAGCASGGPPPDILGDTFSCSSLRPAQLQNAYTDPIISVRRWQRPQDLAIQAHTNDGLTGLTRACQELLVIGDQAQSIQIKFKIVRVQLDRPDAGTEVHCHLAVQGAKRRRQQNAVWLCRWQQKVNDPRPGLVSIDLTAFEEVLAERPSPLFADCTASVFQNVSCFQQQLAYGLDYWRDRMDWRFGWEVVGAHGLAVGDVNGDGLDDLYLCETGGLPNRLLVQQDDGTLRDVSAESGVNYLEPAHSALLLDLDNDGDQDLVMASGMFVVVLENDGRARFLRRIVGNRRSTVRSLAAADFDNNGLLDIYVCGYSSRDAHTDSIGLGRPMPYHDANNGAASYLLANHGDFRFEDVTAAVGLDVNNRRFSYAAAWEDYDNDGDLDLYVANDFGRNNLYRNENGNFTDVAAAAGVEDVAAGMSVSWGDYNRDGLPDLYVGNMFSSAGNRIAYQRQFKESADVQTRAFYQRHARGNSLFENNGDGTFHDVSHVAAVTEGRWAWSSNFVDLNNDGWEDLVVANGMVTGSAGPDDL